MFEIGNSLREARMRRGVDFAQAEVSTKIRGKYLRALEDEQFELLPAQTYVKGFLRTYAEYLGLDGQLYVDEFNSRFVSGTDEHEPRTRRSAARPQRRTRRIETNVVLAALGAIAILTVIVFAAASGGGGPHAPASGTTSSAVTTPGAPAALLTLTATRGSTHVAARVRSANGDVAYDGTIQKGDPPVAIRGRQLWVQIDSPENLRIQVRGKLVHVPGLKPRVIIVTANGWRPA
ncbi:MAG TPA: helix-turn-helix domain-containing protein [Gaiellaceae bacterium]|nr:helix-turn-helix domain-containing protein [Gaiellaceae bacterium]